MRIQLSDHFTYPRLLRFVFPSIVMMIFTSIYGVVDGLFVSNLIGKTPFAAINLIWPYLMGLTVVGFMIGSGGTALISRSLGEGKKARANEEFSLLVYVSIGIGLVLTLVGMITLRPVAALMGAEGELLDIAVRYGRIVALALTPFMLQTTFQTFFITAEKPKLGLLVTVLAGLTNMVLDALFIAVFRWGVEGAALATTLSQFVGGIIPLVYFSRPNNSLLQLGKTKWNGKALLQTCTNGSSELMTNLSMSVVNALYNLQLLRLAGENGVAAYGVIMYANFIFVAIFVGYAIGSAPIVGYHFGAGSTDELKNLFRKSLTLMAVCGVMMLALGLWLAPSLSRLFVGYDAELLALTTRGFRLYSLSFLLMGFNIFSSAFFTALSNGPVSAAISFLRTLLFQAAAIFLLPLILPNADGVWLAVVTAEALALIVTGFFFVKLKNRYQYA
ncbi:MAG: MATE family efflux transporter [Oscillibacter sp.]|nr:MATE family efflux transporter [Oscillibacter sp.]